MIQVYTPASIANIGVGFDALGIAVEPINGSFLGDSVIIEDASVFTIKNEGCFYDQLPIMLEQNIIFQCWKKFCKILGESRPIMMKLQKNVPISSGLGSSACSIVASLVAMNCHYGYPLNDEQLLILMGEMEGEVSGSIHFDNVSPCFLGGMQLILPKYKTISQKVPIFNHWLWVLAYPGIKIPTEMSRSMLPEQYNRMDCIAHSRYLSGFIHACYTKQEDLAIQCMQDIIAEPYRAKLLPVNLTHIRESIIKKGAVSCGISGSGPTIFALCNNKDAINNVSHWLSRFYLQNDSGFIKVCTSNNFGARIVME